MKKAKKARQPSRWLIVSEPPTVEQLEHKARLEAEGFRVLLVTELALARAG